MNTSKTIPVIFKVFRRIFFISLSYIGFRDAKLQIWSQKEKVNLLSMFRINCV